MTYQTPVSKINSNIKVGYVAPVGVEIGQPVQPLSNEVLAKDYMAFKHIINGNNGKAASPDLRLAQAETKESGKTTPSTDVEAKPTGAVERIIQLIGDGKKLVQDGMGYWKGKPIQYAEAYESFRSAEKNFNDAIKLIPKENGYKGYEALMADTLMSLWDVCDKWIQALLEGREFAKGTNWFHRRGYDNDLVRTRKHKDTQLLYQAAELYGQIGDETNKAKALDLYNKTQEELEKNKKK